MVPLNPAAIDDPCDYNRDGLVNGTDQIIARNNQTNPLTMLRLITAPTAINELIQNGGFETGDFSGWSATATARWKWTRGPSARPAAGSSSTPAPHSGTYSAYNGFDGIEGQQYTLAQDVAIPADVASATLVTHHRIRYGAGNLPRKAASSASRSAIRPGNGPTCCTRADPIPPPGMDFGWLRREFDLSAYAGQTVRIRFTEIIPESYTGPAILELDDISLTYIAAPPAGPKSTSSEISPGSPAELNWLYELQQANTRTAKRTRPAEAAVDALLATYW